MHCHVSSLVFWRDMGRCETVRNDVILKKCNTFSVGSQLQSKRLRGLGHAFRMPNARLPVKSKGFVHLDAPGLVSMMLRYVTIKTVVPIDLIRMLRTDCSAETRLALHVPSSLSWKAFLFIISKQIQPQLLIVCTWQRQYLPKGLHQCGLYHL